MPKYLKPKCFYYFLSKQCINRGHLGVVHLSDCQKVMTGKVNLVGPLNGGNLAEAVCPQKLPPPPPSVYSTLLIRCAVNLQCPPCSANHRLLSQLRQHMQWLQENRNYNGLAGGGCGKELKISKFCTLKMSADHYTLPPAYFTLHSDKSLFKTH